MRDERRGRAAVEFVGCAGLTDAPGVQNRHAIGDLEGLLGRVRDQDGGDSVLAQVLKGLLPNANAAGGVKVGERLIEQHETGSQGERSGEGGALLFTAAELRREPVGDMQKLYPSQQLARGLTVTFWQGSGDVSNGGEVIEQRDVLCDERDRAFVGWQDRPLAASQGGHIELELLQANGACRGRFEPRDGAQQGGFSRARGAQKHVHLALQNLKVDLQQRGLPAIAHIDGAEVEQGHRTIHGRPYTSRRTTGAQRARGKKIVVSDTRTLGTCTRIVHSTLPYSLTTVTMERMAYIRIIDEDRAQGQLQETYEKIAHTRGGVADVMKVQSLNAHALAAHFELYRTLLFGPSELDRRTREMIGVVVSAANNCSYGVHHHGESLRRLGVGAALLEHLSRGELPDESLSPPVKLLLEFAQRLTHAPTQSEQKIEELRGAGWSDEAILDTSMVAAYFNMLNRITLGLGITLESQFEDTCGPEPDGVTRSTT